MNRWALLLIVIAAAGMTVSIVGLIKTRPQQPAAPQALVADPNLDGLRVPEFSLVDQDGRAVDQSIFDGRITILDFIFTHCPFACPMMTMAMVDAQRELTGTPVQLVSISIDPVHDTPERLREYGQLHEADFTRWRFLTGERDTIYSIVTGSLKFALQEDPSRPIPLKDGTTMSNITHPTKLLLIGPDRTVLGLYDPNTPAEMQVLRARAREAARMLAAPR